MNRSNLNRFWIIVTVKGMLIVICSSVVIFAPITLCFLFFFFILTCFQLHFMLFNKQIRVKHYINNHKRIVLHVSFDCRFYHVPASTTQWYIFFYILCQQKCANIYIINIVVHSVILSNVKKVNIT